MTRIPPYFFLRQHFRQQRRRGGAIRPQIGGAR